MKTLAKTYDFLVNIWKTLTKTYYLLDNIWWIIRRPTESPAGVLFTIAVMLTVLTLVLLTI